MYWKKQTAGMIRVARRGPLHAGRNDGERRRIYDSHQSGFIATMGVDLIIVFTIRRTVSYAPFQKNIESAV